MEQRKFLILNIIIWEQGFLYPQAGTVCGYLSYYISQSETDF